MIVENSAIQIYLGKGNGTFRAPTSYPGSFSYPSGVVVGDFNGDGKQDFVVAQYTMDDAVLFVGNGDGTFQGPVRYFAGTHPGSLVSGDFDGDGRLDLAVGNYDKGTVTTLLNLACLP